LLEEMENNKIKNSKRVGNFELPGFFNYPPYFTQFTLCLIPAQLKFFGCVVVAVVGVSIYLVICSRSQMVDSIIFTLQFAAVHSNT